ncbi:MAG TPA: hypothetical protein VLB90_04920 [Pseudomonadales bacterium]|nr:hypothetical protein [Pseudomonadales bacterium]
MHSQDDLGTIQALLERFNKERLPRAIEIKERVDQGECLTDYDIEFLERVFRDSNENRQYYAKFPEYMDIVSNSIHIYEDIMAKALENEQNRKK